MADADGTVDTNGPVGDLSMPYGQVRRPVGDHDRRASAATCRRTPPSGDAGPDRAITMYDSQGNAHADLLPLHEDHRADHVDPDVSDATTRRPPLVHRRPVDVRRRPAARPPARSPPAALAAVGTTLDPADRTRAGPARSTIDLSGADPVRRRRARVAATGARTAPRSARCSRFSLGNDGTIVGVYSNGLRQPIGQLALANFTNPGGLEKVGDTLLPGRRQLRHRAGRRGRRRRPRRRSPPARWRCPTSTWPRSSPT